MKVAYKEMFKTTILGIMAIILAATFVYGVLWADVTLGGARLYKRMVENTITDMVKAEYLK